MKNKKKVVLKELIAFQKLNRNEMQMLRSKGGQHQYLDLKEKKYGYDKNGNERETR